MRALAAILFLLACGGQQAGRPEDVLAEFLEHMERSRNEESALKDAYALLDDAARAELAERAQSMKSLSGGEQEPWQMLVPGQFRIRVTPAGRGGMRARVHGHEALVTVTGTRGQVLQVPMVWQRHGWRVLLKLPLMPRADAFGSVRP